MTAVITLAMRLSVPVTSAGLAVLHPVSVTCNAPGQAPLQQGGHAPLAVVFLRLYHAFIAV